MISRRSLLRHWTLVFLCSPFANPMAFAEAMEKDKRRGYPQTLVLLNEVYWAEMSAKKHYDEFCRKALSEKYTNIAYLFRALSISEEIHADNFNHIIRSLDSSIMVRQIHVTSAGTKANLSAAALKELEKITTFYPKILQKMAEESHDQTILNCMYSWRSHKQHEEVIRDIESYSGIFFRPLASRIEGMDPNYFVCEICGSTVDEKPDLPCEICNYPMIHYKTVERPTLADMR